MGNPIPLAFQSKTILTTNLCKFRNLDFGGLQESRLSGLVVNHSNALQS